MIKLPSARKSRELADWVEAELLFGDHDSLSPTEVRGLLSDDLGIQEEWTDATFGEDFRDQESIEEDEDQLSQTIESAFLLLETRATRTGSQFPLAMDGGVWRVGSDRPSHLEYSFLVLLNLRVVLGLADRVDHHKPAMLFERLVATALANYLCGEAVRFGVPHPDFEGSFEQRSKALAKRMRERPMKPLTTISAHQGDYGLDVAAWRLFDDRESKIVVLCQCGIGADYEGKCLQPRRWEKVIDFVCTPLTALAIPFEDYATAEKVRNLATDAGLLLDRSRIARFAKASDHPGLSEEIEKWIQDALPSFSGDADDA